ncbi:MAG: hypothetical protein V1678_02565 [Candidatus Aenigmatarchaeota archaeon]
MKRLALLLMIVLFSQLAEAKNILYVANASTDTPCSALQAADALYCNRLANLGYEVSVINEAHTKDNSTTWNDYANAADAIFLGSNSLDMAKRNKSRDIFCGNISAKNKPVFFAFINTWVSNGTDNAEGCGIYLNAVSSNFSSNKCTTKSFKIAKTGFITEGFELNDNITIYAAPKVAKIYNIGDGWLTAECIPTNSSIDFYPVLYADSRNVFWGLDEPAGFSNAAWDIFDRTVLQFLGDSEWQVTAFSLPSVSTVNKNVLIFANATQNGKQANATINFTYDISSGYFIYDSGWRTNLTFSEPRQYNLNIKAYSKSLRGALNFPINVGTLKVDITSGRFKPNSNYVISASIPGASQANYRVLRSFNDVIFSGPLICSSGICTVTIESMPDAKSLLLEVTAFGESVGGALKNITKDNLATDKSVYSPGDTISIDFFSLQNSTKAELTIIKPDGTKETLTPLQMNLTSFNHWSKNYTLGLNAYNGTYAINVKTTLEEYNISIGVVAWNPFAYLNRKVFNVFESPALTVGTTEAYSSSLDISVTADITTPSGEIIPLGNATVKGNGVYKFTYMIPKGYPSGNSRIRISFEDSAKRNYTLYENFSTDITLTGPSLFVTPSTIAITTVPFTAVEKTVTLENIAKMNATNIITKVSGMEMMVLAPSFLDAGGKAEATIRFNTNNLEEGTYSGRINFYSLVGDAEVNVIVDVIGDIASRASAKYAEVKSLEINITQLDKLWSNTTDAARLLEETKNILNETINDYRNQNYESAKSKYDEALSKSSELETQINTLYSNLPDNSYIVWYFAFAVVVVIITVTVIKVKGRSKKQKQAKKEIPKEEPKKQEILYEPKGSEYRTEYY